MKETICNKVRIKFVINIINVINKEVLLYDIMHSHTFACECFLCHFNCFG